MGCLQLILLLIPISIGSWLAFVNGPTLSPTPFVSYLPELRSNDILSSGVTHIGAGQLVGAESFAVVPNTDVDAARPSSNVEFYTGLADGRIVKVSIEQRGENINLRDVTTIARCTDPSAGGVTLEYCGRLTADTEPLCGRPLGLKSDPKQPDTLIVADAYRGVIRVNVNDGKWAVIANSTENGQPVLFPNAIEVSADGSIFFTDSSTSWQRNRVYYETLESGPNGRLMVIRPGDTFATVLVSDLPFANGLTWTHEGDALLIVSTTRASVYRYDVDKGELSTWAEHLPGTPDNIVKHKKNSYLIGFGTKRAQPFSLIHTFAAMPWARVVLAKIVPYETIVQVIPKFGLVGQVDSRGRLIASIQDPTGCTSWLSEAVDIRGTLVMGSFINDYIAVMPVKKTPFNRVIVDASRMGVQYE